MLTASSQFGEPTVGSVIVAPTMVTATGDIQAYYTYTPLTATLAPEPAYGALSALVFVLLIFWRRTYPAREARVLEQRK